ncbi:MAG TPA: hypothetical protein VKU80_06405, partial [Planctomycetota bacterium]|nr:hypothetical protein [Planctomycetota bacterium]
RLMAEFRSPSKARKAMALEALKSFGEAAAERLEKEGLDPALVRGEAAPSTGDLAVQQLTHQVRATIDLQNIPLRPLLRHLETVLGRPFAIDPSAEPMAGELISFKVQDIVMDGALRLLLEPRGRTYEARGSTVWIKASSEGPSTYRAAPVRVLRDSSEGKTLVAKLGSKDPEERDQASAALGRLGFGAEPALWEALDSPQAQLRSAAGELLGRLYRPAPILGTSPAQARLRGMPMRTVYEEGPLLQLSESLMKNFGVSVGFDAARTRPEDAKEAALFGFTALDALSQMLVRERMRLVLVGDVALATSDDAPFLSTPWSGPAWTSPEKARELETLLSDLASDDASRQGPAEQSLLKIGAEALYPLREAARVFDPPAAQRCRRTRRRILDEKGIWMTDEASGAELQALSEPQRQMLAKPVDIAARGLLIQEILGQAGIKADVRVPSERRVHLFAKALTTKSLLMAVSRPYGLDFYVEGTSVVIDTAERVRAVIEK